MRRKLFWSLWTAALLLSLAALHVPGADAVPAGGQPLKGYLALTFDDGPRRGNTGRLLDLLGEKQVKATFFLIGRQIEPCRTDVERMAAEGHQLGLHTWDHALLSSMTPEQIAAQIEPNRALLEELTGDPDPMLRPPYGYTDDPVKQTANAPIIRWSVDPEDWRDHDTARIVREVEAHVEDGAIILLHDLYDSSVRAAGKLIDDLRGEGYEFVTVEQLFALRGMAPLEGRVYDRLPPTEEEVMEAVPLA